jgi:hypothetical protein
MMISREIVRPQFNQPLVVTVDHDPSQAPAKEGQWGTDFAFECNHNSVLMYAPPQAKEKMLELGARAGDTVELVKFKRGKTVYVNVRRVSDAAEPEAGSRKPEGPRLLGNYGPKDEGSVVRPPIGQPKPNGDFPKRAYYQPETRDELEPKGNGHAPAPAKPAHRAASHLEQSLCLAIDAAIGAQEYARAKNFSVTFLGSDIRAMANSVLIGDQQRNGGSQ